MTPPSVFPFNVAMMAEACGFEMINNTHEDEGKHAKDGGAER